MTKAEYTAYVGRVEEFFRKEGLDNLSIAPGDGGRTGPYFSWSPCECCGDAKGGDRYDCDGWSPVNNQVQDDYSVCPNCVYFAEYGRLDDTTMAEIEGG